MISTRSIDQHAFNHRRWDELLESGEMEGYETQRVETDRHGHLVLSPREFARHGIYQSRVVFHLQTLLPGGVAMTECPVSTSDAAWMSRPRFDPMREFTVFEKAPEISVEVLSPSNTRAEMEEKRALYFEIGCGEFWTVGATGKVRFIAPDGAELEASALRPGFPVGIEI